MPKNYVKPNKVQKKKSKIKIINLDSEMSNLYIFVLEKLHSINHNKMQNPILS